MDYPFAEEFNAKVVKKMREKQKKRTKRREADQEVTR